MEAAGAFAILIEGTVEPVARAITLAVSIPTIGIGASPACDGQILVTEDLLGLTVDHTPKFVKTYANLGKIITDAVSSYAKDVRVEPFPMRVMFINQMLKLRHEYRSHTIRA